VSGLAPCLIGMEACATSHFGRANSQVRAHREADASGLRKALCQAWKERRHGCGGDLRGGEPAEHAVCPVKSADQQAVLMLHRTRALLIRQQTMLANAFRRILPSSGSWSRKASGMCGL